MTTNAVLRVRALAALASPARSGALVACRSDFTRRRIRDLLNP
jgi:hypothetical protein